MLHFNPVAPATVTTTTVSRIIQAVELTDQQKAFVCRPHIGTPAPGAMVSVDTPLHEVQRPLHDLAVKKYITMIQTVDWNMFGYVTVVRYSDGSMAVIDGQHRISLVKTLSPSTTEVPAHIIDVKDDAYAAQLFAYLNGVAVRKVSNEELLWAEIIARDADALYLQSMLQQANLSCGKVNEGFIKVKRVTFEKCLSLGEAETVKAADMIKKAFPGNDNIDLLLLGLVYLLSIPQYQGLTNQLTLGKMFAQWFVHQFGPNHTYKEACFKKYQNASQWQIGIAYGLMEKFSNWMKRQGKGNHLPPLRYIEEKYKESAGLSDE